MKKTDGIVYIISKGKKNRPGYLGMEISLSLCPRISKILLHLQGADKLKPAPLSVTRLFSLAEGKSIQCQSNL
jgi:hypothetical protein